MKRLMIFAAALAVLTLPVVAGADDEKIPPELNWDPTPPAQVVVDAEKLIDVLVKNGVLTPVEQTQITQSGAGASAGNYREMDRNDGMEYASQP
jgi:hypothetical protein